MMNYMLILSLSKLSLNLDPKRCDLMYIFSASSNITEITEYRKPNHNARKKEEKNE